MEAIRSLLRIKRKGIKPRLKLIEKGLRRVNHIDREGNSLAHRAVIEDQFDLLKKLEPEKLRLNVKNKAHLMPLDLALYLGKNKFFSYLGYKRKKHIQVYRNKDQCIHTVDIAEIEKKLKFIYTDYLEFASYKEFLVAKKRGEKLFRSSSYRKMNEWMISLHGRALSKRGDISNIYIRHIDKEIGYGVFAAKTIPALSLIGEYTGEVKRRKWWQNQLGEYVFGYHAAGKNTRFIIDGAKKGNFTRFMNHSNQANVLSRWVVAKGVCRIIFFTKKAIAPHQQLTYDYGDHFWRKKPRPQSL